MKILVHITSLNKQLIICLLAITPLFGSTYTTLSQHQERDEVIEDITDSEQDSASSETCQLSYEAVVPILKAGMAPLVFFIIELNLISEITYQQVVETHSDSNSFFKILFRLIISPNGP